MDHNHILFLSFPPSALSRRVPQCFPGCVCRPLWTPQHVRRHDQLHLQSGVCPVPRWFQIGWLAVTFPLIGTLFGSQDQYEASLSLQFWDDPTVDGFHALLMIPKPIIRTSDHLCEVVKLQCCCKKLDLLGELMDHSGNYVLTVLPFILSLLQRGLSQRVSLKHNAQPPLSFGLLLNPEQDASVLERGPPPAGILQKPSYRYSTATWNLTVVMICNRLLSPLLSHADKLETCVRYIGGMLDEVIKVGHELCSTGEEESLKVVQSYDDLSRKLWRLEGLPLSLTSVQGSHVALRYTQVTPPFRHTPGETLSRLLVPQEDKPCPVYIAPVKVICHMEGSGKWPHDRVAVSHIKAAFHIGLGELPTHLPVGALLAVCEGGSCSLISSFLQLSSISVKTSFSNAHCAFENDVFTLIVFWNICT
uniref:Nucleolar protein 6 n=1 Tax=Oncorhynchus mykiss TaxID=8022 RepID=A0A8C7NTY1_ONCMY